jgi:hypothetical protein
MAQQNVSQYKYYKVTFFSHQVRGYTAHKLEAYQKPENRNIF